MLCSCPEFMCIKFLFRFACLLEIGRIEVHKRLCTVSTFSEMRYRIAMNDGDRLFTIVSTAIYGDMVQPILGNVPIDIYDDAACSLLFVLEDPTVTGECFNVPRVWRNLIDDLLVDTRTVFTAWVAHLWDPIVGNVDAAEFSEVPTFSAMSSKGMIPRHASSGPITKRTSHHPMGLVASHLMTR